MSFEEKALPEAACPNCGDSHAGPLGTLCSSCSGVGASAPEDSEPPVKKRCSAAAALSNGSSRSAVKTVPRGATALCAKPDCSEPAVPGRFCRTVHTGRLACNVAVRFIVSLHTIMVPKDTSSRQICQRCGAPPAHFLERFDAAPLATPLSEFFLFTPTLLFSPGVPEECPISISNVRSPRWR